MKRLCFLFPDVESTRKAVAGLHDAGFVDSNLFIIARHDISLKELPRAGLDKSSDALPGLGRGLVAGGIIGALGGLAILGIEELDLAIGGAAIPLFALLGAGMSGLAGLLSGASLPSSRLHGFEHAIKKEGKILLMVDAADDRAEGVRALVRGASPNAEFAGVEPGAPVIP